jgi:hypothetical protein
MHRAVATEDRQLVGADGRNGMAMAAPVADFDVAVNEEYVAYERQELMPFIHAPRERCR